jgi:hypothetical protein
MLGAIGVVASLALLAFVFEKHPSDTLKHYSLLSGAALFIIFIVAKHRLAVVFAIIITVGARGLIVGLMYGYWPGYIFAGIGLLVFLILRNRRI